MAVSSVARPTRKLGIHEQARPRKRRPFSSMMPATSYPIVLAVLACVADVVTPFGAAGAALSTCVTRPLGQDQIVQDRSAGSSAAGPFGRAAMLNWREAKHDYRSDRSHVRGDTSSLRATPAPTKSLLRPTATGPGDPALGINAFAQSLDNSPRLIAASGAGWVRIWWNWGDLQHSLGGTYSWSGLDTAIAAYRAHGLQVLFILRGAPCFATADPSSCRKGPPWHVPVLARWRQFVTDVVRRYKGRIAAYEIWNEPDNNRQLLIPGGQKNGDVQLAGYRDAILIPAARAIRAADPSAIIVAPVIGGARSPAQCARNLGIALGDGAAALIDAVSIHLYPPRDLRLYGAAARREMRALGIANKQLWLTEFGLPADGSLEGAKRKPITAASLAKQGAYIARVLKQNRAHPLFDKMFVFALRDGPAHAYGVTNRDDSPRPAYKAIEAFAHGQ